MILKRCVYCSYHRVVDISSFCLKENCFSQFSKCIHIKALKKFLERNEVKEKYLINKIKEQSKDKI